MLRPENPERLAAELVASGEVVGWVEGGSEFGPRPLGHRSVLADPRSSELRDRLNAAIKRRENFRPFAPSILEEKFRAWFDADDEIATVCRFMLGVCRFRDGFASLVPGVSHVDNTARVQTVAPQLKIGLRGILESFYDMTDIPMILNTSFNFGGEPIIETTYEALSSARRMGLRHVFVDGHLFELAVTDER